MFVDSLALFDMSQHEASSIHFCVCMLPPNVHNGTVAAEGVSEKRFAFLISGHLANACYHCGVTFCSRGRMHGCGNGARAAPSQTHPQNHAHPYTANYIQRSNQMYVPLPLKLHSIHCQRAYQFKGSGKDGGGDCQTGGQGDMMDFALIQQLEEM